MIHQPKHELEKNFQRVRDIVKKSDGDIEKQNQLARTQANKITNEAKAVNRAIAAKELGYENICDVFFRRAYELGAVGKKEFRNYQLEKLGIR